MINYYWRLKTNNNWFRATTCIKGSLTRWIHLRKSEKNQTDKTLYKSRIRRRCQKERAYTLLQLRIYSMYDAMIFYTHILFNSFSCVQIAMILYSKFEAIVLNYLPPKSHFLLTNRAISRQYRYNILWRIAPFQISNNQSYSWSSVH